MDSNVIRHHTHHTRQRKIECVRCGGVDGWWMDRDGGGCMLAHTSPMVRRLPGLRNMVMDPVVAGSFVMFTR